MQNFEFNATATATLGNCNGNIKKLHKNHELLQTQLQLQRELYKTCKNIQKLSPNLAFNYSRACAGCGPTKAGTCHSCSSNRGGIPVPLFGLAWPKRHRKRGQVTFHSAFLDLGTPLLGKGGFYPNFLSAPFLLYGPF